MPAPNLVILVKMSGGLIPANSRAGDVEMYDNGKVVIFESDTDIIERQTDRQRVLELLQFSRQIGFFQLPNVIHDSGNSPNVPDITISITDNMGSNTVTMTSYQRLKGEMRKSPFDQLYKKISDLAWELYNSNQTPSSDPAQPIAQTIPNQNSNNSNNIQQSMTQNLPYSQTNQKQTSQPFELPSLDDLLKNSGLDFNNSSQKVPSLPPLPNLANNSQTNTKTGPQLPPMNNPLVNSSTPTASLPPLPKMPNLQNIPTGNNNSLPPLPSNIPIQQWPQDAQISPNKPVPAPKPQTPQPKPPVINQQKTNDTQPQSQPKPQMSQIPSQNKPMAGLTSPVIPQQNNSQIAQDGNVAQNQQAKQVNPIIPVNVQPKKETAEKPMGANTIKPSQTNKASEKQDKPNPKIENQKEKSVVNPQENPKQDTPRNKAQEQTNVERAKPEQFKQEPPKAQTPNIEYKKPPLAWGQTQDLLRHLEDSVKAKVVVVYVRNEHELNMDDMRYLYSHLRKLGKKKTLYVLPVIPLTSNTVIWRMATLLREFCQELNLIVPEATNSSTTLLALAADSIYMNPFGYLAPVEAEFGHPLLDREFAATNVKVPLREILAMSQQNSEQTRTLHPLVLSAALRQEELLKLLSRNLLALSKKNKYTESKKNSISEQMLTAYPTKDYPIAFFECQNIGLPVVETNEETNDITWELIKNYLYITQTFTSHHQNTKMSETQAVIIESVGRRTVFYKEVQTLHNNNQIVDEHNRWREVTMELFMHGNKESSQLHWKELQLSSFHDELGNTDAKSRIN